MAKNFVLFFALGCLALATARIVPELVEVPRTAVGTCPPRDTNETIFLPDTDNCGIYYQCSNGQALKKECPPDMWWDAKLQICNWELDVVCDKNSTFRPLNVVGTCPPRDTNETIFLEDSDSCGIYYQCSNGQALKKECPPDMWWDSKLQICNWELDVVCTKNTTILMPFTAVGTCPPRDTNETIFLPDTDNCGIYYQCSNGQALQKECPPDMWWDSKLQICNWELDVECKTNATIMPLTAVGTCPPRDGNETVFLPDSSNCTLYYICSNGRPFPATCVPGMVWSVKLNTCDWDADKNCIPDSEEAFQRAKIPRSAVGTCPEKEGEFPVYLPDSDDCQTYYECSGGIPIQNFCPDNLEFNPKLSVCDDPLDAGCTAGGGSTANPPSSDSPSSAAPSSSVAPPSSSVAPPPSSSPQY